MEKFEITIDGKKVEAFAGDTVLQAARRAGIFIPSLCAHEGLSPYGACRLCVVEIDGVRGTPTSCTTPATSGMNIRTTSPLLETNRRRTLELMMSCHPSPCFSCDSREDCESVKKEPTRSGSTTRCGTCSNRPVCELREVAKGSFSREMNLPIFYDINKIEKDDPFIDRDHNVCVLCGRCFRVCEKVHGKPAIGIANRGKFAKISVEFGKTWSSEECLFCGECVDACPTGSLTDRWSKWYGKPEATQESVCVLCPNRCKISLNTKGGKIISTSAVSLEKNDALCAVGRFAYPQVLNSAARLGRAYVRQNKEQIPANAADAVNALAELVKAARGGKSIVISNNGCDIATREILSSIAKEIGADFVEMSRADSIENLPSEVAKNLEDGAYEFAIEFGNYISAENAKKVSRLAVLDSLKNAAQKYAEVLVPVAYVGEFEGEYFAKDGAKVKAIAAVSPARQSVVPAEFLSKVCEAANVKASVKIAPEKAAEDFVAPSVDKSALPNFDFGHNLADLVPDLALLGLMQSDEFKKLHSAKRETGFEVLENKTVAPNFHELTIKAPDASKYAKAGQFAVLMANASSERSPFTISDWNESEGWLKFIVEEVGRSSAELGAVKKGDYIAVLSGPLGTPIELDKFQKGSSCLLLGGCYGIAAIYPIARALKEKGVKVVCAIEASSAYMLYYKEKLSGVCDELIVRTRDGSEGNKGGCFDEIALRGANFDSIFAIGCVFMMKQCASKIPESVKNAFCSLNPIMVDGTGMCGACRVSVGGKTQFACVDGPMFPIKDVDFSELINRRNAYRLIEIEAMPRHADSRCYKNNANK